MNSKHKNRTFKRDFASFNDILKAEISPEGTSADSPEINERNPQFSSHRDGETKHPIHDEAGHAPARSAAAEGTGRLHQLPELSFTDFQKAHHHLHGALACAGVVEREAVGHGGHPEAGIAGEAGLDVGMAAEAAVDVFREEYGDVEVGEAEELRKLQHGVDVALHR